jgi:hypothetical protein
MKTKGTTKRPGRTGNARAAMARLRPEAAQKEKWPWGRRKLLIRLDSAKEIQGFYLDFVAPDLDFVAPGLDFAGCPFGEFGNPPSRWPMVKALEP